MKRHHHNFAACAGHLTAFKCLLEIGAPTSVDGVVVSTVFYTALPSTTTLPLSSFCCHKSLTERRRMITVRLFLRCTSDHISIWVLRHIFFPKGRLDLAFLVTALTRFLSLGHTNAVYLLLKQGGVIEAAGLRKYAAFVQAKGNVHTEAVGCLLSSQERPKRVIGIVAPCRPRLYPQQSDDPQVTDKVQGI